MFMQIAYTAGLNVFNQGTTNALPTGFSFAKARLQQQLTEISELSQNQQRISEQIKSGDDSTGRL